MRVISFPAIKKEKEDWFCIRDAPVLTSVVVQGFSRQKESLAGPLFVSFSPSERQQWSSKKSLPEILVGNLGMHEPRVKCWSCLSGDCSSPFSRTWWPEARSGGLKRAEGHTCLEYRGWWVIAGVNALPLSVMVQKLRGTVCRGGIPIPRACKGCHWETGGTPSYCPVSKRNRKLRTEHRQGTRALRELLVLYYSHINDPVKEHLASKKPCR